MDGRASQQPYARAAGEDDRKGYRKKRPGASKHHDAAENRQRQGVEGQMGDAVMEEGSKGNSPQPGQCSRNDAVIGEAVSCEVVEQLDGPEECQQQGEYPDLFFHRSPVGMVFQNEDFGRPGSVCSSLAQR